MADYISTGKSEKIFAFPSNITNNNEKEFSNILSFSCLEMTGTGKDSASALATSYRDTHKQFTTAGRPMNESTMFNIFMYKPNLSERLSHSYEAFEPGIIDSAISGLMNILNNAKTSSKENPEIGIMEKAKNVSGDVIDEGAKVFEAAGAQIGKNVREKFLNAATTAKEGKMAITPVASMYKGTDVRTQTFTWNMTPRNETDLQQMGKIIYRFHKHSLPERTNELAKTSEGQVFGTAIYKVPKVWMIKELWIVDDAGDDGNDSDVTGSNTPVNRHTPKLLFGPAAITNIEYNTTPDGTNKTLIGTAGDPASIELSITFTELIPIDANMYTNKQNETTLVESRPASGSDLQGRGQ